MKKILILVLLFTFFSKAAFAQTIKVQAMNEISTENPSKSCTIKILDDIKLDEKLTLKCGDIVMAYLIDIQDPKILKRDAKFSLKIFGILKDNKIKIIENEYIGKYTTRLNTADTAKNAALGVGNFFVKGLSMGYHAVEGAIKNEEGNALESSAVAVYKSSPFSYVENGEEIYIKTGELFYLKFKTYKEETEDEDSK